MTERILACVVFFALATGCTGYGVVSLDGKFVEQDHGVEEIRYRLHEYYGLNNLDIAMLGVTGEPKIEYKSMFPDESARFATGDIVVGFHSPPSEPPLPAFWVSFANEKDTLYGIGPDNGRFDYWVYSIPPYEEIEPTTTCWIITDGVFSRPDERSAALSIVVARNPESLKSCDD